MHDNLTEETGARLPTSVNERASDTTNKMASPLFIDKEPSIDWTHRLIHRRWRKLKKKSNESIYYAGQSGEHEIELFNSWDMSAEELKKKTTTTGQLLDESQKF